MPVPGFDLGGGSVAFGHAAPITSQDDKRHSFSTGAFGNSGSTVSNVTFLVAGLAVGGVIVWALLRSKD